MRSDGRYVAVNSAFADLVGLPSDRLVGKPESALQPRDICARSAELDALVLDDGGLLEADEAILAWTGKRLVRTLRFPIWRHGELWAVGVVMADRDDLVEARIARDRLAYLAGHSAPATASAAPRAAADLQHERAERRELQQRLEELQSHAERLAAEVEKAQDERDTALAQLDAAQDKVARLEALHQQNNPERAALEAQIRDLRARIATRDAELDQARSAQAAAGAALGERDAANHSRDAAVAARDAALTERDAAVKAHDAALKERDSARAELALARDGAVVSADLPAELADKERELGELVARVEALVGERDEARAALAAAREELSRDHSIIEEARTQAAAVAAMAAHEPPNATQSLWTAASQRHLSEALGRTDSLQSAARAVLHELSHLGWEAGALWRAERGIGLRCVEAWTAPGLGGNSWETMTWRGLVPEGKGVVAAALDHMRPEWLTLTTDGDDDCPRVRAANRAQLGTLVAVPVSDGEDTIGVLEVCRRAPLGRDDEQLEVLSTVALQLGQHVTLLERANRPKWSMFTR